MTANDFVTDILEPSLIAIADPIGLRRTSTAARMILAICVQESGLTHRYQCSASSLGTAGPARGWAQFEISGVRGVMNHRVTKLKFPALCAHCRVEVDASAVWRAMEGHDRLAIGMARLLLYTHPDPLPLREDTAWDYYLGLWRPGRPDRARWASSWATACSQYRAPA